MEERRHLSPLRLSRRLRWRKALVKFNESLAYIKNLRERIDTLRRERVVFDSIYKKLERELHEKKKASTWGGDPVVERALASSVVRRHQDGGESVGHAEDNGHDVLS